MKYLSGEHLKAVFKATVGNFLKSSLNPYMNI